MAMVVPSPPASHPVTFTDPLAGRFISAPTTRDFAALEPCFAPDIRFRALTSNHAWANFGPPGAVAAFRNWFAEAEPFALLSASVGPIGGRISLTYRFRAAEDATSPLALAEQHLYPTVRDGLMADVAPVCSGFRPVDRSGA